MVPVEIDTLKLFDEIHERDSRQKYFAVTNRETGEHRPITLYDRYHAVEQITLSKRVPDRIREHFDTARNLLVYSWFVYRFIPVAELHAYASLEYALKERNGASEKGLRRLLELAVERGWIKDSSFNHFQQDVEDAAEGRIVSENLDSSDVQDYCKILVDMLPYLRNEIAHGSSFLHPNRLTTLAICADLINQLFEPV